MKHKDGFRQQGGILFHHKVDDPFRRRNADDNHPAVFKDQLCAEISEAFRIDEQEIEPGVAVLADVMEFPLEAVFIDITSKTLIERKKIQMIPDNFERPAHIDIPAGFALKESQKRVSAPVIARLQPVVFPSEAVIRLSDQMTSEIINPEIVFGHHNLAQKVRGSRERR